LHFKEIKETAGDGRDGRDGRVTRKLSRFRILFDFEKLAGNPAVPAVSCHPGNPLELKGGVKGRVLYT